jgi:sporulation protein YlmC with PRC-barrel domain
LAEHKGTEVAYPTSTSELKDFCGFDLRHSGFGDERMGRSLASEPSAGKFGTVLAVRSFLKLGACDFLESDMHFRHFLTLFLGAVLVSTPVPAQPSQPTAPSSQTDSGGWITQLQPDQWQTSNLEGLEVYSSNNGDKIGDISDLVLDSSGKVQAVVIGVGGYLGIGKRAVAVPFDQIRFVNEPRVNTTRTTTGEARLAGTSPGGGSVPSPSAAVTAAVPEGSDGPATSNMAGKNASAPAASGAGQAAAAGSGSTPNHAVLMMSVTKDELRTAPEFRASH